MIKLPVFIYLFFLVANFNALAGVSLTAIPNEQGSAVSLRWNMVNYSSVTAYVLWKSIDGVVWQVAAANPVYRNYTSSSILLFRDEVALQQKVFYRVRVYDTHDNTVAISNTAIANLAKVINRIPVNRVPAASGSYPASNKSWQIYPNPVQDFLSLGYNRSEKLRGVINVLISDVTGKIVIRFRQASNNKQLRIPVSNLRAGLYFIKLNVLNEMQLNEKFVKQ